MAVRVACHAGARRTQVHGTSHTLAAPSCPAYPPPCVPACTSHARTRTPPHLVPSRPPVDVMASPALRRLAMEAKKPRPCEGVRVLGPVSETTPLKYSIEIVGP